jgi:selenide, water dikinase
VQVLHRLNSISGAPPRELLVGSATGDDAAVWRLDERTAIVHTVDFFTPIVDDAYDWGRIAAANAMSDVYAMGGRPILCLNIAAWPRDDLPLDLLGRVLEGGAVVAAEAGAVVAGGHTIDDPEPKYGMAVVGLADPARIVTNAAARPTDVLVLTKPVGIGVIATGLKRGIASPSFVAAAVSTMVTLNRDGAEAMLAAGVRAATDVTGFGLLGHLQRMMAASGTAAWISAAAVPLLDGARAMAEAGAIPGGTERNRAFLERWVRWDGVGEPDRTLLVDAQTSGGLLIACPAGRYADLAADLRARGVTAAAIGEVVDGPAGEITVAAE